MEETPQDQELAQERLREFRRALRIVERELGLSLEKETECCGVSLAQCHLLLESECCPDASLSELAEALSLNTSTMSRTVDALHTARYLKRSEDPENRRKVAIRLTAAGMDKIESIHQQCDDSCRRLFGYIPPEKRALILDALPILAAALREKRKAEASAAGCGGGR